MTTDNAAPHVDGIVIACSQDLPDGGRLVVEVAGTEIGVFRIRGALRAYANYCPHVGGPVCQGLMIRRIVERIDERRRSMGDDFSDDMNIVCPWHGYEFDLSTGRHPGAPTTRLLSYHVWEEGGEILVEL